MLLLIELWCLLSLAIANVFKSNTPIYTYICNFYLIYQFLKKNPDIKSLGCWMFYRRRARGHQDGSFSLRAVPACSESPQGRKRHVSSSLCPLQEFQQELKHTYWILIMEASYLNHYINEAGRELPQAGTQIIQQNTGTGGHYMH